MKAVLYDPLEPLLGRGIFEVAFIQEVLSRLSDDLIPVTEVPMRV